MAGINNSLDGAELAMPKCGKILSGEATSSAMVREAHGRSWRLKHGIESLRARGLGLLQSIHSSAYGAMCDRRMNIIVYRIQCLSSKMFDSQEDGECWYRGLALFASPGARVPLAVLT